MVRQRPYWYFLVLWVITTLLGFVLPVYASLNLPLSDLRHCIFTGSLLLGILQWFVLRQRLRQAVWWIPVTALGGVLCLWLGFVLSSVFLFAEPLPLQLNLSIGYAVSGALLGCGQYLVLRRYRQAQLLIVIDSLAASISLPSFLLIQILASPAFFNNPTIPESSDWLRAAIRGGIVAGMIQGTGLLWVLKQGQRNAT
ncbi:hypothetical protein H6G00_00915 [Leptolyngbya sp. FACHB-541]|uniref:hypothetical protein n=1 Tax=Leptolyngbya sp. FACHB-541 TaxID=2692810 RepID=UPI001689C900|nr:hypothetical protein [Leptolyngbya sp. FACHB-541]MBD1995189.1 hypothetical protein [Leptolyngbya sp. FACHB-541]